MKYTQLLVALATLRISSWASFSDRHSLWHVQECILVYPAALGFGASGFGPKPDDLDFVEVFAGLPFHDK